MRMRWKSVLAISLLLSIGSVIGAVSYSRSLQHKKKTFYEPARVTEAPLVVSQVQGLQITEVRLINQGTTAAAIEIDVTNQRDVALMSIDFIARADDGISGGIAMDGLADEENPHSIMPPHSLSTFTMYLGGIIGEPVYLAAGIFADGKEEGDKLSLERLVKSREQQRKKKV